MREDVISPEWFEFFTPDAIRKLEYANNREVDLVITDYQRRMLRDPSDLNACYGFLAAMLVARRKSMALTFLNDAKSALYKQSKESKNTNERNKILLDAYSLEKLIRRVDQAKDLPIG